jgi:3-dehydroquinate dehydratase
MSMICYVLGLSPTRIKALRETHSLASDVAEVRLDKLSKSQLSTAAQVRLRHMVERSALSSLSDLSVK